MVAPFFVQRWIYRKLGGANWPSAVEACTSSCPSTHEKKENKLRFEESRINERPRGSEVKGDTKNTTTEEIREDDVKDVTISAENDEDFRVREGKRRQRKLMKTNRT